MRPQALTPFEVAPGTLTAAARLPAEAAGEPGAIEMVAGIGATMPPDGIRVIPPPGAGRREYCE